MVNLSKCKKIFVPQTLFWNAPLPKIYKPSGLLVHEDSQWEASLEGLLEHSMHLVDPHVSV